MYYTERNEILSSAEFKGQCRVALCDWVEYWAINGTAEIADEKLRDQTDLFIKVFVQNADYFTQKAMVLVISDEAVKNAEGPVTDGLVMVAVDRIMANAIGYMI